MNFRNQPLRVPLLRCAIAFAIGFFWQLSGSGPLHAAELLRWKLAAGETLRYEFTQSTQTETTGPGKPMRVALDSTMRVSWRVEAVDDRKVADISQTVEQFRITLQTDKLDPITYDSASKSPVAGPARDISDAVKPLIGCACQLRMTDRGEIVSVEPSEQLRQALRSVDERTAQRMLTPDGISRLLSQAAVLLPEKPVAAGETWISADETPSPAGRIRRQNRFTYVGRMEHEGAMRDKLSVESEFELVPDADSAARTSQLKSGPQTGAMWFDSAAGRFTSSELEQQLATERPYRDLKIVVRSSSKLSMKLLTDTRP
jgi:hypothetical protein